MYTKGLTLNSFNKTNIFSVLKRFNSSSNDSSRTLNSANQVQHINDTISGRFWPNFKLNTTTAPINRVPETLSSYDVAIDFNPNTRINKIYIPKVYDSENVMNPIKYKLKNNKIIKALTIQELTTDPSFLSQFLWDSGEIKPREFTKLTKENHTKIVNSIVWCRKQNLLSTRHKYY
ncbi:hypothetical protein QEN19_004301 [Hanseniaspora menglaensis]